MSLYYARLIRCDIARENETGLQAAYGVRDRGTIRGPGSF